MLFPFKEFEIDSYLESYLNYHNETYLSQHTELCRRALRSAVASVPPIDLFVEERKETFQLRKELTYSTNLQEITRAKEAIRKNGRCRFVEKWQTRWHGDQSRRWTHRLIQELATWLDRKHDQVGFYQRRPVEIASGPALAVLRLGRTWLSAPIGGGIFLFLARLARLVSLPDGRVFADGSPGRTVDERVVRDFRLEPTAREV